jgi:hypothetical protein
MIVPLLGADFWTVAGSSAGIIAAVVAVVALARQFRGAQKRRAEATARRAPDGDAKLDAAAPPLELKLSWMFPTYTDGSIGAEGIGLTLVNRLEHPVQWTASSIDLQDGSGRHMVLINTAPPGMGLPRRVEPHSSEFTLVAAQQLQDNGFDLARPITARASTATGETITSQPWTPGH